MAHSRIAVALLVGIGLAGCSVWEDQPASQLPKVGDQVPVVPEDQSGVTSTDPVSVVSPATLGTVTQVTPKNASYAWVSVQIAPPWQCPSSPSSGVVALTNSGVAVDTVRFGGSDYHGLAALRRPVLKSQFRTTLDSTCRSVMSQKCSGRTETQCRDSVSGAVVESWRCNTYSNGYGGAAGASYGAGGSMAYYSSPGAGGSTGVAGTAVVPSAGATQYSTTNTQVATVDEADFVKNDANTIFLLAKDGLHVVDAWPAAEMRQIAKIALPGEPRRLFLDQNRLVVYSRMMGGTGTGAGSSNPSDQGCTYGYDCRFQSEGGHTMAVVFDVSQPATPVELVRYEMSGGYVASRRVGNFVYTVLHDTGPTQVPGIDTSLPQATSYEAQVKACEDRAVANDAAVDSLTDEYMLPWMRTTTPGGEPVPVTTADQALAAASARGESFITLSAFDLTKLGAPTRSIVASQAGYVFASPTALYVAVDRQTQDGYSRPIDTVVHKFALDGVYTRYRGGGLLPGHILNQFAMDEYVGVLRVASTSGWVPAANVSSSITTFGEQGGSLVKLGEIAGIAPTEDIRSVRFEGDRGFVVTFKKTDPLFAFDLADPAAPRVLGELLIPGFSTYMHPLDRDHLLAIGYNADDMGSFAWFNGIQIQIFDVSVLSAPKLMWKYLIGTRGSSSEALTNHLAFNYFPPKKMLALPMTICEGGGNGTYGDKMTFAGLMAFDISLETGIAEHGRLGFGAQGQTNISCGTWWTDATSLVKRSIFMDDFVYGISDAELKAASLGAMSTPLASVSLTQ